MIGRLRRKFLAAALVAVILVLALLIGAINVLNYRSLVAEADGTLEILTANRGAFPRQMLREQDRSEEPEPPAEGLLPPAEDRPEEPLGPMRGGSRELAYQTRYFAAWFGADGELARLNLDNLVSLTETEAAALAEEVFAGGDARGFSGAYRFCRSADGAETLLLFLNCERELATFRSFALASVAISLAGTLAVFLLLLLFSGRIVRPIADSYEKQRRFITDAGHELKTPITIIRADADVLESELEGENEWIADIRRQTGRLADLTGELVYLSRMEEENPSLQMQPLPFSELVDETARSFQAPALAGGKHFEASVAPDLQVSGDEKALAKLVSILLENAMKYSPAGGTVALTLARSGRSARLTVKNSTQPMEKGNADRLFERFTREDRSRSSESGGFGLGLAIARAVVEAHRGRIHAQSEDGASLTVTAELPLA